MSKYLYRRGNGNDGDFPRFVVELADTDDRYAALRALVANDYIAGHSVRRYIVRNLEVHGEVEFGLTAVVYEGPHGEKEIGSSWLTAALEPCKPEDVEYYTERFATYTLNEVLDGSAKRMYKREYAL